MRRRRLAKVFQKMGLSIEWYDAQPKQCGICGTTDPGQKSWCIDHDHKCCPYGIRQGCSKCVRGLLCNNCNRGLGYFSDSPEKLNAAIAWIENHRNKNSLDGDSHRDTDFK
ncbi:MAG TPA: endonuclease domain-containing protein [Gemmataceae bacterium]|nr:endonuclease domain-containing protein [Gemmataceae bacterium]